MNEQFDAVIIGSGFGGSVMAYRLAEAGFKVCILERGKVYPPGSFPRSPHEMKNNFWDPSEGLYGMYNVWSFRDIGALVSSGLGGGSLIYGNILIRKDEKWFVKEDINNDGYEYWPVTRKDLDPHYDQVEEILNAQRYPFEHEPYNNTPKTKEFKAAAEELGLEFYHPKQSITFKNKGKDPVPGEPICGGEQNIHNKMRFTCRLCGECNFGCNFGSKNTLDYNYLTMAEKNGAVIRSLCEVKGFKPNDKKGYEVNYIEHNTEIKSNSNNNLQKLNKISCTFLIVSAGTLGSTFLMLKNSKSFPKISSKMGSRFGGNGDILGIALNSRKESSNGDSNLREINPGYGPVITSAVRVKDALEGGTGRGYYIQDGGYPEFINWMIQGIESPTQASSFIKFLKLYIYGLLGINKDSDISSEITQLLAGSEKTYTSLPLLGMGRDIPDGIMKLRDQNHLDIDWNMKTSKEFFNDVRGTMKEVAYKFNADFMDNPLWYLRRGITVHPLGGCPMGRNEKEGVVDSNGEVFNYPGLYISDGSIMPGPVGPNPSLTIAALSNRFADNIISKHKNQLRQN